MMFIMINNFEKYENKSKNENTSNMQLQGDSLKTYKSKLEKLPVLLSTPISINEQNVKRSNSEKFRKTQPINIKVSKSFDENTSLVQSSQDDSAKQNNEAIKKELTNTNENMLEQKMPNHRMLDENNNEEKMNQSMNSLIAGEKNESKNEPDEELIVSLVFSAV